MFKKECKICPGVPHGWGKPSDGQWERWRINDTAAGWTGGYLLVSLLHLYGFIRAATKGGAQLLNVTAFFSDTTPLFLSPHWSGLEASRGSKGPALNATPWPQNCLVSQILPQDLFVFQLVAERKFKSLFVKRHHGDTAAVKGYGEKELVNQGKLRSEHFPDRAVRHDLANPGGDLNGNGNYHKKEALSKAPNIHLSANRSRLTEVKF